MATPRVLVIEDDHVVTETLTVYLEQAGFAVSTCRDGVSGLAAASAPDVAVVILDLMIPGMLGQEVCRRLRASSSVPVLMLTARTAEADRITGLELGADDYVGKPFSPREIVARVQALVRRTRTATGTPPAPLRVGDVELDGFSRQVRVAGRPVALTRTEFRLLEALFSQPGRTFTRDELVARAFGPDYEGTDRTIDTHITNLRRKLEPDEPRHIVTVHGVGYRLAAPDA
ncbi:MAG TPA: response regulator transcription factor [Vicinamibacterales bacterium]|nr:response regulator transcription factor [Vicinamibacterales bacterium]